MVIDIFLPFELFFIASEFDYNLNMLSSTLLIAGMTVVLGQNLLVVSQIADGQPQAPDPSATSSFTTPVVASTQSNLNTLTSISIPSPLTSSSIPTTQSGIASDSTVSSQVQDGYAKALEEEDQFGCSWSGWVHRYGGVERECT